MTRIRLVCLLLATLLTGTNAALAQEATSAPEIVVPAWVNAPSAVAIPKLGTEAPVVPVGLEEDGAMAVPIDPDTVGWYALGSGLGAPGNAVLAGHVDWDGTLRAFGHLSALEPGDLVSVTDANGAILTYRVEWNQFFDADTAPVAEIFAQGPREELTLITCGGVFDAEQREYLGRVVVRAVRSAE